MLDESNLPTIHMMCFRLSKHWDSQNNAKNNKNKNKKYNCY